MKTSKLKIALVGCGRIGKRHAQHISDMATLVGVCDIVPERAKEISEKYGCASYTDYEEMLEREHELDLVSICTPNGLHASQSIMALAKNINVVVEKPMALSVSDCERMISEAENANKRLFVVKQNRFNLPVQELKNMIDNNILGKIYTVQINCFWNRDNGYYMSSDWRGSKEMDGGTLFTQFSHFIDLMYWLFGDVDIANGFRGNYAHKGLIEFEDSGVVAFKLKSGALGSIVYSVNSHRTNYEGSLTVIAEKGTVKIGGKYLNHLEYQSIENHIPVEINEEGVANDYGTYQGSMSNHDKVYRNIIEVLTENKSIKTSFMDGMKTVQIIENMYNSMKWTL